MCIAEMIVGILLLINPVGFTRGIIIALGVPLTLQGIGSIVSYIREKPQAASEGNLLAKGLMMTCGGLFCMFLSLRPLRCTVQLRPFPSAIPGKACRC